jgi:hypothetical protein
VLSINLVFQAAEADAKILAAEQQAETAQRTVAHNAGQLAELEELRGRLQVCFGFSSMLVPLLLQLTLLDRRPNALPLRQKTGY